MASARSPSEEDGGSPTVSEGASEFVVCNLYCSLTSPLLGVGRMLTTSLAFASEPQSPRQDRCRGNRAAIKPSLERSGTVGAILEPTAVTPVGCDRID